MNMIFRILAFLSFLFLYSGCQPTGNNFIKNDSNFVINDVLPEDDEKVYNTATPPPFPDLRGLEYDVYFIGAVSDIYFAITASISDGLRDGINFLNSTGGINGAKLKYNFVGVREYGEVLLETISDLIDENDPFLILLAAPISQEVSNFINASEIPILYFGVGSSRLEVPDTEEDYLFWLTPLPDQEMGFVLREIWANWEEIRPMGAFNEVKVAYLTWSGDQQNLSLTPQARVYIQRNNYSLAVEQEMSVSPNSSVTNFLLDAVSNGVTVLFTDTLSFGPAVLWNDLHSLGLANFFVVSGTQWMVGEDFSKYVRIPSQSDEMYFPLSTAWWTEVENPAITKAIEISNVYGREEVDRTQGYLLALGAVDIMSYVLREIVEEQAGGEIDSQLFMEVLANLENYSVMDGLFEVDYLGGVRVVENMRLWCYSNWDGMIPIGALKRVPNLPLVED